MQLAIVQNNESIHEILLPWVEAGKRVALVPTMGALHQGHAALIEYAATQADIVVVSIFVNPTQFAPTEDLDRYPRQLEQDASIAQEAGAHLIYAPTIEEIYPEGFDTKVSAGALGQRLCGESRAGHFDAVATIVTKLLMITTPHVAIFGEKDYQQLVVIRHIVDDLNIPIDILGVPTVREESGLALSSRNSYLTKQQRTIAPKLYDVLSIGARQIIMGAKDVSDALKEAEAALTHYGFDVEYLALCHSDTLAPLTSFESPARLLVAARLGATRLIDNIALE